MKTMHGLLSLHLFIFALGLALLLAGCFKREPVRSNGLFAMASTDQGLSPEEWARHQNGLSTRLESRGVSRQLRPDQYAANEPTGDRDLGPGAGGERLGDPSQLAKQPAPDPLAGERYAGMIDNPFRATHLPGGDASTFGLEADRAAMATLRRWVQRHGRLPPPAAVRIEEMLNSMRYDYPQPDANSESFFAIDHQLVPSPWTDGHWLLRIGVQAKSLSQQTRAPLNLVFLVDTSGSMNVPESLPLVKHTLLTLLDSLDERDNLSIVTYAGTSQIVLPATTAAAAGKVRIRQAIESLEARGYTNGAGGINAAYAEAAKGQREGVHSRIVLCTDGDYNVGISDPSQLRKLISEQRKSGVYLSVYGYGQMNYNDHMMKTLALHGNGIYAAITDREEAQRIAGDDALGQMVTVAKDAKVQMFFNPQVVAGWRLIGYENRVLRREDFNNDQVDSGEIGSGHQCTVLYEIIPAGSVVPGGSADDNPFLAPAAASDSKGGAVIDQNALGQLRLRAQPASGGPSVLQEHLITAQVAEADSNTHLAAAIAALGMRLRASPYRGSADFPMAARLLAAAVSDHPQQQAERNQLASLIRSIQGL